MWIFVSDYRLNIKVKEVLFKWENNEYINKIYIYGYMNRAWYYERWEYVKLSIFKYEIHSTANFVRHKCNIHIKYQMVYTKQWKTFKNGIFWIIDFSKFTSVLNPCLDCLISHWYVVILRKMQHLYIVTQHISYVVTNVVKQYLKKREDVHT